MFSSGKSKGLGVMITHSGMYKFQKCGSNKKGDIFWWTCGEKRTSGCPARAHTRRTVSESDSGTYTEVHELTAVSNPEV